MATDLKSPLRSKRIVLTRAKGQSSELKQRLELLGAEVLELPVLSITKEIDKHLLADVMLELGGYDWIVFTSAHGVSFFFEEFRRIFDDIRSLGLMRIACVGEGTARGVTDLHLKVECQPKVATAEALANALIETGSLDSAKVLVVMGNLNRDILITKLESALAIVDKLQVYKTEKFDLSNDSSTDEYKAKGADAVLFASSSAVQFFAEQNSLLTLGSSAKKPLYGSIGPQTSTTLKKHAMAVDFEAEEPGLDALIAALIKKLERV
jgi:uroporphyrinogen-III synthase